MPRVVKNVFWRILLFYILSVLLLGLDIPYNYPGLFTGDTATSPFTIVFQQVGAKAAGSFINAVILTSVLSAGNHALFAGTRLLYTLGISGYAPRFFSRLNKHQVPWVAVLATSSISLLCFGASFIGAGDLWSWLQNLVGVSNMLSWIAINLASLRFRAAVKAQGKLHTLPFKNWTYPWGPVGFSYLVLRVGACAGMELLQPELRWSELRQLLYVSRVPLFRQLLTLTLTYLRYRAASHASNVCRMEAIEADKDSEDLGDGFGDGCVRCKSGHRRRAKGWELEAARPDWIEMAILRNKSEVNSRVAILPVHINLHQ